MFLVNLESENITGADPGGGANRSQGRQHTKLPNFPKNCMKLRKFRVVGGAHAPVLPLNLPMMIEASLSMLENFFM